MILAEKISMLRKKEGWSQEELAEKLDVTRQSVSKWESAQSIPDIDRILQMSRLFGVTTDFLLKDELNEAEPESVDMESDSALRCIKMEEAREYLELSKKAAPKMALGTFFCIISPIVLLLLAAMSEISSLGISENAAGGIGVIVVIIFVALGVIQFFSAGTKREEYEFLEKENFKTEYGVAGMVKECRKQYQATHSRYCMIGTVICILSVLPLFVVAIFSNRPYAELMGVGAVCLLLFLVGIGAAVLVYSGTYQEAMDCLLEEKDYTRKRKAQKNIKGPVSLIYWLVVAAIYLYYTFGPNGNGQARYSWFILAIGGVLFGAVLAVVNLIQYFRREK